MSKTDRLMLTRIYTPYGTPTAPIRPRPEPGEDALAAPKNDFAAPRPVIAPHERAPAFDAGGPPSRGLASAQETGQRIRIGSILQDFQSTMDALGADEATRDEVRAYLGGVAMQARKEKPDAPFIKQSLRTAANSLDQFIAGALGSPSQVVREWVDALLMQPIDFHQADAALAGGAAPTETATTAAPPPGLSRPEKARIKDWMDEARTASETGNHAQAQALLGQALDLAEARQQPGVEGRILHQLGRSLEATGKPDDALTLYRSAAEKFAETGQPKLQARSLAALGGLQEQQGALSEAETHYGEALGLLEGEPALRSRLLNDLGSLRLRQGKAGDAIESFQAAYQALPEKTPQARADLFSNMGAAYRQHREPEQALKAYKLSLSAAREARSRPAYRHALQQIASLYVDLDQPAQARRALTRLEGFRP